MPTLHAHPISTLVALGIAAVGLWPGSLWGLRAEAGPAPCQRYERGSSDRPAPPGSGHGPEQPATRDRTETALHAVRSDAPADPTWIDAGRCTPGLAPPAAGPLRRTCRDDRTPTSLLPSSGRRTRAPPRR